ncbi:MAG: mannonate dehydratase [Chloroflexota bacterium]
MKLGLGLYQALLTPENLRFAKQAGCTHIVAHLPGYFSRDEEEIITSDMGDAGFGYSQADNPVWTFEGLRDLKTLVESEGLVLEALENFAPAHWYDVLLAGPERDKQISHLKEIIRNLGKLGIPTMGYCFTVAGTWGRTEGTYARGEAKSVGFENPPQTPIPGGMVWNMIYDTDRFKKADPQDTVPSVSETEIWARLAYFLDEVMPVAEEANVNLAFHPDDPPLPKLRNTSRLVYHGDHFQKVLDLKPSRANLIEFCIGTVTEMPDTDVYETVERYSRSGKLGYVHFRNVQGKAPHYHEMFIDDGDADMIRILRILHKNGFDGVLIPDHTPLIECDAAWHAGMAYALGWMKAALTLIGEE